MLVAFVRYCVLLDCKSLVHVDFIPLFVIHVWHPRYPLNGIKKYLISLWGYINQLYKDFFRMITV